MEVAASFTTATNRPQHTSSTASGIRSPGTHCASAVPWMCRSCSVWRSPHFLWSFVRTQGRTVRTQRGRTRPGRAAAYHHSSPPRAADTANPAHVVPDPRRLRTDRAHLPPGGCRPDPQPPSYGRVGGANSMAKALRASMVFVFPSTCQGSVHLQSDGRPAERKQVTCHHVGVGLDHQGLPEPGLRSRSGRSHSCGEVQDVTGLVFLLGSAGLATL